VSDPVIERLDEALADARAKLTQVIVAGQIPHESMRMLIEVRQDLVFMARETGEERRALSARIEELDRNKVDKNPNATWMYRAFIGTALTSAFGLLVWLLQGGGSP
jgi:flagellar biosynthesis protein FliP